MAQEKALKLSGLSTQYNPLSLNPGALLRANDCSMRRENVIEDRRGYKLYGTVISQPAQLMIYENRVIAHHGSAISYDNGSGTFGTYAGTYAGPTGRKMRHLEASSNLYVTTSAGVKVFTDVTGTAGRLAGAPRALNSSYVTAGATGFLANNFQCAYRSLIKRTDANENVIKGYPSQRMWAINSSGGARNLTLTVNLPSDILAGDVIEVYRTEQATGVSTDSAGDEMGLIYQYEVIAADVSAGLVAFTDSVTDALRGASLYTNPSEEGIAQANDRPPLAKDIALYKAFMLFANTKTKHRLFSTLVGAGRLGFATTGNLNSNTIVDGLASTSGLAVGWKVEGVGIAPNTTVATITSSVAIVLSASASITSTAQALTFYTNETITLSSSTYRFGSSEITSGAGSPQVRVSTTGVAASDIDLTARSLEYVVNRFSTNTSIYAYYISGPSDTPGKLMFEERGLGASAFTIQASNATLAGMFFPAPPTAPTTSVQCTSSQDERVNAVYVAKSQQNEHVPALNYLLIGPANKEILRVVALRDSAIVIKEEGVYRITGDTFGGMVVTPIDLTVYCKAADSVAVLANQVFMLSNQGVVLISEAGVQVISREIEPSLLPTLNSSYLADSAYGAAYESERSYYLTTLTNGDDTFASQTLVYNIFTRTWVRHTYAMVSAIVEPDDDKIYFAKRSDFKIYVERKDFAATDYADPEYAIAITTLTSPDTVEFTLTGASPAAGWIVSQAGTDVEIDSIVTLATGLYRAVLVTDYPGTWSVAAAELFPSVGMDIEFHSFTGQQSPDVMKQVRAVGIFSDDIPGNNSATRLIVGFRSNNDPETELVTLVQPSSGWGGAWGSMPWGGTGDSHGYPTWVPRNKQYCTRMNVSIQHKVAREKLVITGIGYVFEAVSDRIGR